MLNRKLNKIEGEKSRHIGIFDKGLIAKQNLRSLTDEIRDRKIRLETKKIEYQRVMHNRPSVNTSKNSRKYGKIIRRKIVFRTKAINSLSCERKGRSSSISSNNLR